MSTERIDGETPNGGAYSIAFFFDDAGQPVAKAAATRMVIHEYDSDDRFLAETVGTIDAAEQTD